MVFETFKDNDFWNNILSVKKSYENRIQAFPISISEGKSFIGYKNICGINTMKGLKTYSQSWEQGIGEYIKSTQ